MARALFESVLSEVFPFWEELSEGDKEHICQNTLAMSYPKGNHVHGGYECAGVFLVRSGCLRVYMLSENGKEITLYRLHAGDMCMLASSCVLQSITFDVLIDAEENSECYVIDGTSFAEVAERCPKVKIFALETAVGRFSDVMWVMQQILFMSMDRRLAIFLLDESARIGTNEIKYTHEQIAKYMGSAREVVSRTLKYFAAEEMVELSRKGVLLLDKKRLRALAL